MAGFRNWRLSEVRATVSTVHDSMQILVWAIGGVSIVVALLTGVQLLPEIPELVLTLPDPRQWISPEHVLYRWMLMVLGLIAAFSVLFALGSWLTERGAQVRGEVSLVLASMTALAALLVARGLTELSFGSGWALSFPEFGPGWDWLKDFVMGSIDRWLPGWRGWAAVIVYGVALFVAVAAAREYSRAGKLWVYILLGLPIAFVMWVLLLWPMIKIGGNLGFYFAFGTALFYVAHYGERRVRAGQWLAWAVLLIWCGYGFAEATSASA